EHLLAAASQLVEEVPQSLDLVAVGGPEPTAQQPPERVVEVTAREQVVGQSGEEVVGIEVGEVLGAVPFRVVVAGAAHGRRSTCGRGRGRGPPRRPCSAAWSGAGPRGGTRASSPSAPAT